MDLFHPTADVEVRPTLPGDVAVLAERLRAEDVAEIVAASGLKPIVCIGHGYLNSEQCWTVLYKGTPSAMFGVCPSEDVDFARFGAVWFLGSDDVPLWGKTFCRLTQAWVRKLAEGYDLVGNVVDERQREHIRWLRAAGFRFIKRHPRYGALGLPFQEFVVSIEELNHV